MPESAEAQVKEALLALLKDRDIQHITMKEIAEKAKVSRGSLYLYYEDKFSIIEDVIEDMKEGLGKALRLQSYGYPSFEQKTANGASDAVLCS
ncbi:hypothetical protein NRS6107_20370 [Bacillus subtilis]|nr:hypothetical protein NRS6107_02132 [Bacillus subtilis]CAI6322388.1 hypothetical protein NRS6107_20370 [Bacillus subtilis]